MNLHLHQDRIYRRLGDPEKSTRIILESFSGPDGRWDFAPEHQYASQKLVEHAKLRGDVADGESGIEILISRGKPPLPRFLVFADDVVFFCDRPDITAWAYAYSRDARGDEATEYHRLMEEVFYLTEDAAKCVPIDLTKR